METVTMTDTELLGELSPAELSAAGLDLRPYRVVVSSHGRVIIGVTLRAADSCAAILQALHQAFPDFDSIKPANLRVVVEAVR